MLPTHPGTKPLYVFPLKFLLDSSPIVDCLIIKSPFVAGAIIALFASSPE